MRILLVEDNPGDVRLLRESLAEAGAGRFELTNVDRLSVGLERLAETSFDVVLLDLSLPDSQGLDTVVRMRAASKNISIVVLTGVEDEELGVRLIQAGAQDYLVKGQVTGHLLTRSLRYAVERERVEAALREQTRILHSILHSLGEGVVVTAPDDTPVLLNPAAERILGISHTEETAAEWMRWLGRSSADGMVGALKTELPFLGVLQGADINNVEMSTRNLANSEVVWISVNARLLEDDTGAQRGRVIVFRDVTKNKAAEEELRESEARFRAILDNSPALIFLKDVDGRYLLANRKFEEVFHLANRNLIGKTDDEIFPPAQAAAFRANDRKVLGGGAPMEFEEVALHDDGPHTSIVMKFPLLNAQGQCSALCGIATDITERKRAEAALQIAQTKLRQTLQASNTGLWDWNTVTNEVEFTTEWKRQLGYKDHEIAGRFEEWEARLHPADRERAMAYVRAYLEKPEGEYAQEFRLQHKDGSYRWIAARASFAPEPAGRRVRLLGSHIDITGRKRAEEQLRDTLDCVRTLSQRLEAVREEERTRIARELHDELGVRLTCLKLDLARLQSMMGESIFPREKMEEKILSMTAEVDSTIASAQGLVAELRPGVLDDLGLVAAIEWQCQDFERRSGIRCCCEAREGDIQLDRRQATAAFRICQEALMNVARHAKATSIRVLVEQLNGDLLLEIQDNGLGIPVEKLTDSASLGLLGMRERAASLGGQIEIAGQPGKGTTVMLRLPCSEQADK